MSTAPLGVESRLSKEIEGKLSLGKELVPKVQGKVGSTPAKMERKWALNVLIARLARFQRCISGGTN